VRIGVVSDTHLPRFGTTLPRDLRAGLSDARVDLIVHLGDFTAPDVPALFAPFGPFEAVAGNNDGPELVAAFGRRRIVTASGIQLGLTHGDLGDGRSTPERAIRTFEPSEVDVVLFGHSHIPVVRRLADGRWLMNPGSSTDKRRQPHYTWGLVTIDRSNEIHLEIRSFDDRAT
jgi:putative phosphoesterase